MIFSSTRGNSSTSSVAREHSIHLMKHMWSLIAALLGSNFNHRHLASKWSKWISHVESRIGKSRPWHRSVPRFHLSFPRRRAFTSMGIYILVQNSIGMMISRTPNGWNFYFHLLL